MGMAFGFYVDFVLHDFIGSLASRQKHAWARTELRYWHLRIKNEGV